MDWWEFYEDRGNKLIPFLRRNLKRVEENFALQASLAINGLHVLSTEECDEATIIEDLPWEKIAQVPLQCQNILEKDAGRPRNLLLSTTVSPTPPPHGPEYDGYAQLKLRREFNQLISWSTKSMRFVVNGSQIYPLAPISLVSSEGLVTLEISIPDLSIAIEAPLNDSGCTAGQFDIIFQRNCSPVALEPKVKYFRNGECVATMEGYTCPFTQTKFDCMRDLLQHHHNFHLNLFFGVHPAEHDAIIVEDIPVSRPQMSDTRLYRSSTDYESLFTPALGLILTPEK